LLHKLRDAAKKEGPRGYLVDAKKGGTHEQLEGFRADFLDSATLDAAVVQHRWLIKQILVADQPAIVGGPKKSLKTSLVIDLALSLGTGKPFLSKFEVPKAAPVLVLSGESGMGTIRDTAVRVARAKGIAFRDCNVLWGFRLPRLSCSEDLGVLTPAL